MISYDLTITYARKSYESNQCVFWELNIKPPSKFDAFTAFVRFIRLDYIFISYHATIFWKIGQSQTL